jgi:hypothetical protein
MGVKGLFSKLFSRFGKSQETGRDEPSAQEEVSPFARFMQPESLDASQLREQAQVKDIFLLDDAAHANRKPVDTVGLFFPEPGALLVRDPYRGKAGWLVRLEGEMSRLPLFGDWTGNGRKSIGFYDPNISSFSLWYDEDHSEPDLRFLYGPAELGWIPLVGDWDGDGKDGIGLYDPASGIFYLRNELSGGESEILFMYGPPGLGWIPLAGDWDGDGKDGIGVYDPLNGRFLLKNTLSGGSNDNEYRFANPRPGWIPLAGDWNGDGADSIGIYDPENRAFYLRNRSSGKDAVIHFGPQDVSGRPFTMRWMPDR